MARRTRKMYVTKVVTVAQPIRESEWQKVQHVAVMVGVLLVLMFDQSWYWQLATVLFSGSEIITVVARTVNHLFVFADVYLGRWVEYLLGVD